MLAFVMTEVIGDGVGQGHPKELLLPGEHCEAFWVCNLPMGRGLGEQMGLVAKHIKRHSLALAFPVQEI